MKKITQLCSIVMLFLWVSQMQGQNITGTVYGDGSPLLGATVVIKGTTQGVVSDFDGKFSLKTTKSEVVLVFSYIGFVTQEVIANPALF